MFFASDDEAPAAQSSTALVPKGELAFLSQPCTCQKRTCYQQFLSQGAGVLAKRAQFKNLPSHEKVQGEQFFVVLLPWCCEMFKLERRLCLSKVFYTHDFSLKNIYNI